MLADDAAAANPFTGGPNLPRRCSQVLRLRRLIPDDILSARVPKADYFGPGATVHPTRLEEVPVERGEGVGGWSPIGAILTSQVVGPWEPVPGRDVVR